MPIGKIAQPQSQGRLFEERLSIIKPTEQTVQVETLRELARAGGESYIMPNKKRILRKCFIHHLLRKSIFDGETK